MKTRFFHFRQANSGGKFYWTRLLRPNVIIEAESAIAANAIALTMGIYFEGASTGLDCNCNICGDRWEYQEKDDEGYLVPKIYNTPLLFVGKNYEDVANTVIRYSYGAIRYGFGVDLYQKAIAVPPSLALAAERSIGMEPIGVVEGANWRCGDKQQWVLLKFSVTILDSNALYEEMCREDAEKASQNGVLAGVPL